jgi:hypothetical protein
MPRIRKDEAPVLVDSPLIQGRYGASLAAVEGAR